MSSTARVRNAGDGDLATLVDFIAREAIEAEGRTPIRETLERGIAAGLGDESIARYWLLTDDTDTAIGCTSVIREWSDWNAGFYWWIQSMYIAPGHRGKGLLTVLLDAVVEAAREDGCLELRLYVHAYNEAAVRAYEKTGFGDSPYRIMSRAV